MGTGDFGAPIKKNGEDAREDEVLEKALQPSWLYDEKFAVEIMLWYSVGVRIRGWCKETGLQVKISASACDTEISGGIWILRLRLVG
jgi:hypothetical protein